MKSALRSSSLHLITFFKVHGEKLIGAAVLGLAFFSLLGMDFQVIDDPFREGKFRYLLMSFTVCVSWSLWRCNPFWAVFAGWAAFRWILADYATWGCLDVLLIIACLVVGDAARAMVRSSAVAKAIAIAALLQGCYGLLQVSGIEPLFTQDSGPLARLITMQGEAIGTFGHPTLLGPFVALGALLFMVRKNWILAAVCVAGTLVTGSVTSVLSLGSGLIYLLWRKNRKVACAVSVTGVMTLVTIRLIQGDHGFFTTNGRLPIWGKAWDAFLQAPWIGWGPGGWIGYYPQWGIPGGRWVQVHNEFLQLPAEYGSVGLVIVLSGLAYLMWKAEKMCPTYGAWVLALVAGSSTNFLMHMAPFGLVAGWLATVIHHHRAAIGESHGTGESKPARGHKRKA